MCLPKSGAHDKKPAVDDPVASSSTVPDQEPGSPKHRLPPRGGLDDDDGGGLSLNSPAPPDSAPGHRGGWQAPTPPMRRKKSLQVAPEDMSHILTQVMPGSPKSGGRSPLSSPELSPVGAALLPPPKADVLGKRCLAIDLDETLVHTERQPSGFSGGRYDFKINVKVGSSSFPMYVAKRPGCDEFLQKAAEHYELIVFTASVEAYCSAVMERIDPHGYVAHALDRRHCTFYQGEIYVKDLARLGRSLRDTILLDNNADCYLFQPENAIPINSWYDDPEDTDLLDVLGILDVIAQQKRSAVATLAEIDSKLGWQRKG